MVERAHLRGEGHGQEHGRCAGDERDPGFERGLGLADSVIGAVAGAGENGVVARAANGLDELLGRGDGGIEDDVGAMGHEVDARGVNAGGGAQGLFDVMLAGGTGHAEDGEGERLRRGVRHLLGPMSGVAGLGESGDGGVDGRGLGGGGEAGCADADLVDGEAINSGKGLAGAAHAGTAVHSIDLQGELGHVCLLCV